MPTIGIIGASGQVGTEVCLYLRTYTDVRPIAVVRSPVSAALLRRLGIEVRIGEMASKEEASRLLADCDLVADFSVPTAEVARIKEHYRNNLTQMMAGAPKTAGYVFISTINAFGMSPRFNRAKHHWWPHSVYALTKRYGESLALRLGKATQRNVWVFRLGHVHGLLQRVSQETAELVRQPYSRFIYPDTPSYTVFCHSIAEGLKHAADRREAPGVYTVISNPAWSWREVLHYYAPSDRLPQVELVPATQPGFVRRLGSSVRGSFMKLAQDYRDTLRANVLQCFPAFEQRLQADYYIRKAHAELARFDEQLVWRAAGIHEGVLPGRRLASISDSRITMAPKLAQVSAWLDEMQSVNS